MGYAENLVNQKFGRLTVIGRSENLKSGNSQWICRCDCGNITKVSRPRLINGTSKSCGCLRNENAKTRATTHGKSKTKLYNVWQGIKRRCNNLEYFMYPMYGARGIAICIEWLESFDLFYDWAMQNGYTDGLSIERMDNNGNYEPSNCKWATKKEQARNRRTNRLITYKEETHCVYEWAEMLKINPQTLFGRINRGWSIEKSFGINNSR